MSTRSILLSLATVFIIAPASVAAQTTEEAAGISVGAKAPGAAVETLEGKAVNLSRFIGKKPVVMEFWATWCPLCRKLEPQMQALRKTYGAKVNFVSVGVPQNQTPERQRAHARKEAIGGQFVFDRNSAAIAAYKVPHTSYVVIIDAAGTVVYTGVGAEQDLAAAIRKAFAMPAKGSVP